MISTFIASAEYTAMVQAVLAAVLGIVAVVFFVALGMLITRDKAEKTRLSHDEYKRELPTKKEIREQKREKKQSEGTAKRRHGKKNKSSGAQ